LWLWTYSLNVANLVTHVNWDHLNHFWTLALEEQFYLLWPMVVWLCPRRRLERVCIGSVIGLTLIRVAVFVHDPASRFNFALGNFDCDGLFFGAWLAARSRAHGHDLSHLRRFALVIAMVSGIGLALVFRGVLHSAPWTMTVKFPLVTGLLGAAFVLIQSDPRRLFAHPWLRFFGKYSYALYVLHYPLIPYFVDVFPMGWLARKCGYLPAVFMFTLCGIAGSVMLALASWHLLEKHFLRLKRYFPTGMPAAPQQLVPVGS
jgi:peptidoglycan/LPS O-acetylase OafA/YrhL